MILHEFGVLTVTFDSRLEKFSPMTLSILLPVHTGPWGEAESKWAGYRFLPEASHSLVAYPKILTAVNITIHKSFVQYCTLVLVFRCGGHSLLGCSKIRISIRFFVCFSARLIAEDKYRFAKCTEECWSSV